MTKNLLKFASEDLRKLFFEGTHLDLLARHLAMTGEECFARFCKIFLRKSKYAKTGLALCKLCEACCSPVLNGTWSNAGISCSISTELELPLDVSFDHEEEGTAVFGTKGANCNTANDDEVRNNLDSISSVDHPAYQTTPPPDHLFTTNDDSCKRKERRCLAVHEASHVYSEDGNLPRINEDQATFVIKGFSCDKWFKAKEDEIRKNLDPIVIHVVTTDDDDCERKDRRCLAVHEASLVCSEEGIIAHLYLNVESEAVDQAKLKEALARAMSLSNPSKIKLEFGPRSSTSVLLLLPPQAGMELLSIVFNSARNSLFLNALSSAICSQTDNAVSVSVQISALPPIKLSFVPTVTTCVVSHATFVYVEWVHVYFALIFLLATVVFYTSSRHRTTTSKAEVHGAQQETILESDRWEFLRLGAQEETLLELDSWEERCKLKQIGDEFTSQDVATALDFLQDIIPRSQLETLTKGIDVINAVENFSRSNNVSVMEMITNLVSNIGNERLIERVSKIVRKQQPSQSMRFPLSYRSSETLHQQSPGIMSQLLDFQWKSSRREASVDSIFESVAIQLKINNFTLQCSVISAIEKMVSDLRQREQLRVMFGAEGPTFPLLLKFKVYMQERPFRCLPHLLAAAGHRDNLAWYLTVFGSEKVQMRHQHDFWLPLDWAASTGQIECVSLLLQPEYKNFYSRTDVSHAMLWAAENGHLSTTRLLLEQGANPRYRDPCGDSALHYASRIGRVDVLRCLIPLINGESDYPTFFGQYTALHEAASCGQPEAVRTLLLDYKADPNARSQIGQTPLMLSVSGDDTSNYWKCIQILLQLGAKSDIHDYFGQTVFDLAEGNPGCTILLIQYGAFPEFSRNIKDVNRQISLERVHPVRFDLLDMLSRVGPHQCYDENYVRLYAQTSGPQSRDERFLLAHHLLVTLQKSSLQSNIDHIFVFLFWDMSVIQRMSESFRRAPNGGWISAAFLTLLPQLRRKLRMLCSDQLETMVLKFPDQGNFTIQCSSTQYK